MEKSVAALIDEKVAEGRRRGLSEKAARLTAPYLVYQETGKSIAELLRIEGDKRAVPTQEP